MTIGVLTPSELLSAYDEMDRLHKENHEASRKKEHGAIVTKNGHRIAELQITIRRSNEIALHFLHDAFVAEDLPPGSSPP